MIRNVLLPLLLILLAGVTFIYCWYEPSPASYIGIPAFAVLGFGSLYLSYYIGYALFPDKRNIPLPPFPGIIALRNKKQSSAWTKGSVIGLLLTLTCWIGFWIAVPKLIDQYKSYHIHHYGQYNKALVTNTGYTKGIGDYAEYEYITREGKKYNDRTARGILVVGDTLSIIYSTERPIINEVIKTFQ
ncbi:hypothetical protein [Paraflavitalea speifideaquila]|uniref:hypothetical protein n=1 Tax=Paraflavitalea speifideaquila TaxID=3076558 RepID=UPI0028E2E85A|nr:hypothetical protein [Paraflavitalea speifideiaquila]